MPHADRPDAPRAGAKTVVVIGGGFTGAVVAHQIARRRPGAFRIVVVEPRAQLGAGVAYSTQDPAHRINVPSARMTFVPSDPCHFDRWLRADGVLRHDVEAELPDGRAFPRRAVFGRYAAATLEPYLLSGAIEHAVAKAASVRRMADGRYAIALSDGMALTADAVALAATHPPPGVPSALAGLADDPRLIVDSQRTDALAGIAADARVLIVGTGLTMTDIVASLDRRGCRGPIVAVSRRGLLSRGHAATPGEFGTFANDPSRTARALVRRLRRTIAAAAAEGRPWQHVLDAARAQGPQIWAALPSKERRSVVRRLRPFWDVHRFRVAPQVEAVVTRRMAEGGLQVRIGTPAAAERGPEGVTVTLALRHGVRERHVFDAIVLATGPAHGRLTTTDSLVSALAAEGLVTDDSVGLGLTVDARSRAIGADGAASPSFWIAGPLARGTFGELMGLPEVARHAESVAGEIVRALLYGTEDDDDIEPTRRSAAVA